MVSRAFTGKAAVEGQLTTTRNEATNGRVLVIFVVICMTALRFAIWAASTIILWLVYGREQVAREHLQIVKIKPRLVVSNGDILWQRGFEHFLIGSLIWLSLSVALFMFVWRLLPQPYHKARQQGTYSGWSLLAAIFLFFATNLVSLKLILLIAPMVIAALVISARAIRQP